VFTHALRLAAWPVLISLVITPLRVALELAGVPTVFVFPLGLLWLALGFSVFLGTRLGDEKHPYLLLFLSLVIFSPPSRVPVFAMWWVDTTWALGTHYGDFDSLRQALFSQLFWGSAIQVIPGFLIGAAVLGIKRLRASGHR
jgi:hypothetical protein